MNRFVMAFLLAAASAAASDVAVYMELGKIPISVYCNARAEVTWMFARAGIRVKWTETEAKNTLAPVTIAIGVSHRTDANRHPGALAYAHPFGNNPDILVMYDRVGAIVEKCPKLEARLLAHVLSHEICHVLQRTNVHAEAGLMKARWRIEDYRRMAEKPLPFTQIDMEMMHHGLAFFKSRAEIH
jgi:hypothetical protein